MERQTAAQKAIDENLRWFGNSAYEELTRIVKEFKDSDKRISYIERNGGYYITYKEAILFRAAVNVFSERTEVLIDGTKVVVYNGTGSRESCQKQAAKVRGAIERSMLNAFGNSMRIIYLQESQRL